MKLSERMLVHSSPFKAVHLQPTRLEGSNCGYISTDVCFALCSITNTSLDYRKKVALQKERD